MRLARPATNAIAGGMLLGAVVAALGVGAARAGDKPARTTPAVTPPRHCICTTEYNPVCGRTPGGVEFTFSNPCRARCVGATVIRRGPC